MTMNPFEKSTQQLLRFLTSNAEQEVIDYIRQEMQHDAPDSISNRRRTVRLLPIAGRTDRTGHLPANAGNR